MHHAATPPPPPEPGTPRTLRVLGTPLRLTTYADFIRECAALARESRVTAVDFTNTQIVTMRRHEPRFREITAGVDHFIPDGMPLIWCLNRQGAGLPDRVYGPTFLRRCVLEAPEELTHYFLGGSEECLARLTRRFQELRPALRVAGARHGYFPAGAEAGIVDEINRLGPDLLWVGLGTPKQQQWIHRWKPALRRGVVLSVGFAFDVNAGLKPDAPAWMQRAGLTWLFRLGAEPGRLFSRYLRYNTLFLYYLLRDGLGR